MSGASTASSGDHNNLRLPTPTLDAEFQSLLQSISAQGGYAYARMAALAVAGDQSAAEAARDMAWEQLHSGPWHSVLPVWRDAYSMACLHVAKIHFADGEFGEALGALDMGLIMGGMLLRKDLHDSVLLVSSEARKKTKSLEEASGEFKGEKLVPEVPVDLNEVRHGFANLQVLVLKILPCRSLTCRRVEKRSGLSLEGFLRDYFLSGTPVVITNSMAHWPARTKWNHLDYLNAVAGNRTVPVEVGKNYLCSDWKQELVTFSKFLERIRTNKSSPMEPTYLAQHPLFDQINELRDDICIPDYCFVGGGELQSLNAWFGPAGTVTPLHHDPHHNILAQVVGKKYIRLYPSSLQDELYPYSETMLCNSSQVDLDNIDKTEFPKATELEFMDCILEEGEMLYIPPKWWHYVRSLTMSFSVSFWWSNETDPSSS
ncbi:transcription factor jumonji domain-containing protein [Arabidopsis lyrata subsp. lyrata]|uniref:Transcription factor jumonji domain-containing protein n=1 Tax=Arabidopsis lyrata subsp. lyrata TaxID=81972 RepID=D7KZW7_ARALL|nr:transcription factor jumonji domain-containing protein [Arabidopsis lyrata subsp. lyrata]